MRILTSILLLVGTLLATLEYGEWLERYQLRGLSIVFVICYALVLFDLTFRSFDVSRTNAHNWRFYGKTLLLVHASLFAVFALYFGLRRLIKFVYFYFFSQDYGTTIEVILTVMGLGILLLIGPVGRLRIIRRLKLWAQK